MEAYNILKRNGSIKSFDDYVDRLDFKRKYIDSYLLSENNENITPDDLSNIIGDMDIKLDHKDSSSRGKLIGMMQESMCEDKTHHLEYTKLLKEQIEFLHSEVRNKNKTIKSLVWCLERKNKFKQSDDVPINLMNPPI